jgi:hypothetical protein
MRLYEAIVATGPGTASCAPNAFGTAFAKEAHENEQKIRRFVPPFICRAAQMQAVPLSTKNIASPEASSLSVAARNLG